MGSALSQVYIYFVELHLQMLSERVVSTVAAIHITEAIDEAKEVYTQEKHLASKRGSKRY